MTADEIKATYTMEDILLQYGIRPDRKGFISCPFHRERTASMKIYKDSYYCFGCGASGDIFSFVQKMDGIGFKDAFKKLGGTYEKKSDYQRKISQYHRDKSKETARNRMERLNRKHHEIVKEINELSAIRDSNEPTDPDKPFPQEWCDAVNRLEYLYYCLDYINEERRRYGETSGTI